MVNKTSRHLLRDYSHVSAQIWPECTDPQKFIHEDVAIAAYLILLWRQEREALQLGEDYRQSFIDIGCGNGLLVYLLASEGFKGKGIDIRARKIWSFYPKHVHLEVICLQFSMSHQIWRLRLPGHNVYPERRDNIARIRLAIRQPLGRINSMATGSRFAEFNHSISGKTTNTLLGVALLSLLVFRQVRARKVRDGFKFPLRGIPQVCCGSRTHVRIWGRGR